MIPLSPPSPSMGMPRPKNGGLNDEAAHLFARGFYVEPLNRPLDMKKIPEDGNEYAHQVRFERNQLFPMPEGEREFCESIPFLSSHVEKELDKIPVKIGTLHWRQTEAKLFSNLALKLKNNKQVLTKRFPQQKTCPVDNEKDFCLFALGSKLYRKIYDGDGDNIPDVEGHNPYLSIVLHFTQDEIALVLQYMRKWYGVIGVINEISVWVYSLFAVFQKPLSEENEKFLEDFYDELNKKLKKLKGEQKNQMYLISSILLNYFCVKAHLIGPPLDRFKPLF